jgi:hypothetical protein
MALNINHAFVSAKADNPDPTIVDSTIWNAGLVVSGGVNGQLMVRDSTKPSGAEWTDTPELAGATIDGIVTTSVDGIGTTSTDGSVVQNATAATSGVPVQLSPRILMTGQAWDTDDTVSRPVKFFLEVLPASAAGVTGTLRIGFVNPLSGAITYPLSILSSGNITALASLFAINDIVAGGTRVLGWTGRSALAAPSDGVVNVGNGAQTIGSRLKADALPTIASGFGTSPSITAGSTPLAGQVNVGTGGVATSGVINFNGTAFGAAPFVVAMNQTTGAIVRAVATTTQLTITGNAAFAASDLINWICIGSRA